MAHKQIMKHQIISDVFVHWSYLKFFKYNEANFVRSLRSCLQKILRGFRTVKNWERTREAREREWVRKGWSARKRSKCVCVCVFVWVCVCVGGWVGECAWMSEIRKRRWEKVRSRASKCKCLCVRKCESVRESARECKRVRESVSIWQCQPPAAKSFHLVKEKNCVKIFAKDKWTN